LSVPEPVDIILLSYNRADYLAQMVAALERRTQAPYRLTIVDNASGAATRQWLRANAWRFHQIIWNERNEHLAGLDRGIRATESEIFVVSDADLVVGAPTSDGCWLTRLLSLAARHDDFGLIAVRLDSISAARNARLDSAPRIDGELLETPTGVWLNLIRRSALRVPYMSDGITCHALRRAGYRVGIAANIYATHLGDGDAERHPDYLARKQVASGWSTTYPRYPSSLTSRRRRRSSRSRSRRRSSRPSRRPGSTRRTRRASRRSRWSTRRSARSDRRARSSRSSPTRLRSSALSRLPVSSSSSSPRSHRRPHRTAGS